MAARSRMIEKRAARKVSSASIRRASQSLMAGVASMYEADRPRMKPMLRTESAVLT